MVVFAAIGAIAGAIGWGTVLQVAALAFSIAYQRARQKKLQAELDRRKQVNVAVDGEPFYLPIVYGRAKVAGGKVKHLLKNNYVHADIAASGSNRTPSSGFLYDSENYKSITQYRQTITQRAPSGKTENNRTYTVDSYQTEIVVWGGEIISSRTIYQQNIPASGAIQTNVSTNSFIIEGPLEETITFAGGGYERRYGVALVAESGSRAFQHNMTASIPGSQKQFLYVQQAICFGGIDEILDIEVDEKNWDDDTLRYGQRLHVYLDGGVADPMATANGLPATNTFTNTAYASMVFRLNRDDYNYSGSPNVTFFVRGNKVHSIIPSSIRLFYATTGLDQIHEYLVESNLDLSSSSSLVQTSATITNDTSLMSFCFSTSGYELFVAGDSTDSIYQYALQSPFDLSSLTLERQLSIGGTTAGRDNSIRQIFFDYNGTMMFIMGSGRNRVMKYDLSRVWDISTATFTEEISLPGTGSTSFQFSEDGSRLYILDSAANYIRSYTLTRPFVLSSATYDGVSLSVSGLISGEVASKAIVLHPDGHKLYLSGDTNDRVYEINLVTPYSLSGATYTGVYFSIPSPSGLSGLFIRFPDQEYDLSPSKTYSNNPARVLLDYLISPVYGRGLSLGQLDLASFYRASLICDTVVREDVAVDGRVFLKRPDIENEDGTITTQPAVPPRDLPLYECNTVLDSERPIRENIELILESMNEAELVWSGGRYSLKLEYPTTEEEQEAIICLTVDEDDIVRGSMDLSWPDSSSRYNQVTARFKNEHENFVDDTVTWPTSYSTAFNTYMLEDSNQPLKTEVYLPCTIDPYHALAKAEQMVRSSRASMVAKFTLGARGILLEPGDIISVTDATSGLDNEVMKVLSVELSAELTAKIEAIQYSYETFAWNVEDDIAYSDKVIYNYTVPAPTDLVFTVGYLDYARDVVGELTWSSPDTVSVSHYIVEASPDSGSTWLSLGTTVSPNFLVQAISAGTYEFAVTAVSPLGRRSSRTVTSPTTINLSPTAVSALTAEEEIYYTNLASGVKTRVVLSWNQPSSPVFISGYLVEYKLVSESSYATAGLFGTTSTIINDLALGDYNFRVTAVSAQNVFSTPITITKSILNLSSLPSDPTGLTGDINRGNLSLRWDKPSATSDLDVLYGGYTQIRFTQDTTLGGTWESSQILVDSVDGSATSKTVPVFEGKYLIKHFDSGGRASLNAAQFINTFADNSFNFVSQLDENPSFAGTKVNCSVVSSTIELDEGQTTMTYYFSNELDLGIVTNIRLVPNLVCVVSNRDSLVASYPLIAALPSFSGPTPVSNIQVQMRTTEDDPSGTPTWTDWRVLTIGLHRARGFQFRLYVEVENTNSVVSVSQLGMLADKEDVIKTGTSTSSSSSDTTVTFDTPFYSGVSGTVTPRIGMQTINGSQGDEIIVTARDEASFSYSVYNGGSRVVRTVDWQAIGQ